MPHNKPWPSMAHERVIYPTICERAGHPARSPPIGGYMWMFSTVKELLRVIIVTREEII